MGYNVMMNFIKKKVSKIALLVYVVFLPVISFAQDVDGVPCSQSGKICNPIPDVTSIPGLIEKILKGVIQIGLPIVALAIIYSGFLFVFARGNSEKLTKARETLMYTLIGSVILLGSWAIAEMIQATVTGLGA